MNYSYDELKQEYLKIKCEEKSSMAAIQEDGDNIPVRDNIAICSRNMTLFYLSAHLCLYDENEFSEDFKIYLFIVEAYARSVFISLASVCLFIKTALCDTPSSIYNYIKLFTPDLITNKKSGETQALVNYIIKLSNHLLKTNYKWYGKALIQSTIDVLQSYKFFTAPNKRGYIKTLTEKLKKYKGDYTSLQ